MKNAFAESFAGPGAYRLISRVRLDPEVGEQSKFVKRREQGSGEQFRGGLGELNQSAAVADKADKITKRRLLHLVYQTCILQQFKAFFGVVQKSVRAPFGMEALCKK